MKETESSKKERLQLSSRRLEQFQERMAKSNKIQADLKAINEANERRLVREQEQREQQPVSFLGGDNIDVSQVPGADKLANDGKLYNAAAVFTYEGLTMMLDMMEQRIGKMMSPQALESMMTKVIERKVSQVIESRMEEVLAGATHGFTTFMDMFVGAQPTPEPTPAPEPTVGESDKIKPDANRVIPLHRESKENEGSKSKGNKGKGNKDSKVSRKGVTFEPWNSEEDEVVAKTIIEYVAKGSSAVQASKDLVSLLSNRTEIAISQRWNAVLRKKYLSEYNKAKTERKINQLAQG